MAEIYEQTAAALSDMLSKGEVSSKEIMAAYLSRIDNVDGKVRAFNSFDRDDALLQADAADKRRMDGLAVGPLDGIPVALKDVIAVKDQPLTASSNMLKDFVSPYDAHVTELLKRQGAVLFGRLNLDEFAMGSSTENSGFARTCNPWDLERIPGGSSGGSAAAVAAGEAPFTLGSDTGGSIRQPASLCGCVGMKPTYGLVSRYGLIAFASSLDQIGPFAKTVEDAALLLQGIVGHDRRDSTSINTPVPDYRAALKTDKKWRLGVPKEYFGEGLDPEVRAAIDAAIKSYESMGHEIVEVSLPTTELAVPVYYILAPAEASSNLSRYDGIRYGHRSQKAKDAIDVYYKSRAEGFGAEVKRRIILGAYVLSSGYYDAYYLKAQKARTIIRNDFNAAFEKCDALLTPTSPTAAFKAGEKTDDPLSMYLSDIFTINVNLAGLPGVSVPCGFTSGGLPIGLQIIGKAFEEAEMLAIAHAYEQQHDWSKRMPAL
ncbi:Asp-tRNA(Asn)/Glu-tRNA(Gln) amidotransferase subunit GatA [Cerasicoccus fimbriatus]|uniref:Asp-tRNA(Asn)/Glu-tRNA(Gln) amidotransferase subunit GatA n=1 Tax=Cerasicoccus fimbriatus TaxID=3014554 RepID=UPI0022B4E5B5|nr:Asp-tRNA(Asn)/Glu-tRNA(Gln) amidotransferase subunit GatA [Cerasicoccus sp. TK19100]